MSYLDGGYLGAEAVVGSGDAEILARKKAEMETARKERIAKTITYIAAPLAIIGLIAIVKS